jgi:carbon-monoxide dehydrogenase medium subunit
VLGAILKVEGTEGEREIPIDQFFKGPGRTVLKKGEILKEIVIPPQEPSSGAAFIKMGRRVSEDISVVSAAAFISLSKNKIKNARVSLGSVAPIPLRAHKTEDFLNGKALADDLPKQASAVAMDECNPITDIRASATYRKKMVGVLTRNVIKEAIRRASIGGA